MDGPICTICSRGQLHEYKGRPFEKCDFCGGKARHRLALELYKHFISKFSTNMETCLHLAPERCLSVFLQAQFGSGYLPVDAVPEKYPYLSVTKVVLPDGLMDLGKNRFSLIIHNHVLEHIAGHYMDHLYGFREVMRPDGLMIFSVPGPYNEPTVEGGEFLNSDEERLRIFSKTDHYKKFGPDLLQALEKLPGFDLLSDSMLSEALRARLFVRPGKGKFFILRKIGA